MKVTGKKGKKGKKTRKRLQFRVDRDTDVF